MRKFKVIGGWDPEVQQYVVMVPELDYVGTQASTREAALRRAEKMIRFHFQDAEDIQYLTRAADARKGQAPEWARSLSETHWVEVST